MESLMNHVEALAKELQDLLALSFEDYLLEQKLEPGSRYSLGVIVGISYAFQKLVDFRQQMKD